MYYVEDVKKGSLAYKKHIRKGDFITHINMKEVTDGLMYGYLICNEKVTLNVLKKDGKHYIVTIRNNYEDIGIINNGPMVENPKSCHNKCIFCFIDQLPKGMRSPLYFKDDDTRLSFLTGNYVTFTNVTEEEFENIIKMRLSPVNVSVHTTDDELRKKMLNNRFAGGIKDKIKKLIENNITVNAQIVLCKNINDKEHLEKSLCDLYNWGVSSVSVVPMGQTKFRDNLEKVELFTKEDCIDVINTVNKYGDKAFCEKGMRFAYPADEFFIKSEIDIPKIEYYDDFPQIENGVGMIASFKDEFEIEKFNKKKKEIKNKVVVCGYAAYDTIKNLVESFNEKFECNIEVIKIKNNFFGENITVSGLLTGADVIEQLKGKEINTLLLPKNMFRAQGDITLDDIAEALDALDLSEYPERAEFRALIKTLVSRGK